MNRQRKFYVPDTLGEIEERWLLPTTNPDVWCEPGSVYYVLNRDCFESKEAALWKAEENIFTTQARLDRRLEEIQKEKYDLQQQAEEETQEETE